MKELEINLAFDNHGRTIYQQGDIVGVKSKGIIPWISKNAIVPSTDLFHFFLIGDRIGNDYEILESIGKGVAVGRLSFYKDREYVVFRVNHEASIFLGERAFEMASKFGRYQYDWKLYGKIFAWALGYWLKEIFTGHIPPRPVYPTSIPYKTDKDFICIELVFEAWKEAGFKIRESGHAPVPAEIILAQDRGDLVVIDNHDGTPETWRTMKSPLYTALYTAAQEVIRKHDQEAARNRPKPGPDLIARQGGQKRNRVHIYRQPFGYPIRACDWIAAEYNNLEVLAECQGVEGPCELEALDLTLNIKEERIPGVVICKHCRKVAQGERNVIVTQGDKA